MRNTVKYSKLIATSWLVISCALLVSSVGPNYEDILNGFSDPTRLGLPTRAITVETP
ncbi:MAG: hypothetical protein Ct9H90mP25_0280 [Gammaproteobacteria bacterium]|nr:MAG: hypothetical protein Ct9H90mP25_0280 [Gammaproteobacteria bacterium]